MASATPLFPSAHRGALAGSNTVQRPAMDLNMSTETPIQDPSQLRKPASQSRASVIVGLTNSSSTSFVPVDRIEYEIRALQVHASQQLLNLDHDELLEREEDSMMLDASDRLKRYILDLDSSVLQVHEDLDKLTLEQNEFSAQRFALSSLADSLNMEHELWSLAEYCFSPPTTMPMDLPSKQVRLDEIDMLPGITKCRRIIEWLENLAAERLDAKGGANIAPTDDPAYRMEYSRRRIKASNMDVSQTKDLDFSVVHAKSMDPLEANAEKRLLYECFQLLRAGRIDEIRDAFRQVGQPWRAALIPGTEQHEFSRIDSRGKGGGLYFAYREAATEVLAADKVQSKLNVYERAMYAAFCGQLEPLLCVCELFYDDLWARFVHLVDSRLFKYVSMLQSGQSLGSGFSWETLDICDEEIVHIFSTSQNAFQGDKEYSAAFRRILSFVALGSYIDDVHLIREAYKEMREFCESYLQSPSSSSRWILRICAHLVLLFREARVNHRDDSKVRTEFDSIVLCYVDALLQSIFELEQSGYWSADKEAGLSESYQLAVCYAFQIQEESRLIDILARILKHALYYDLQSEVSEGSMVSLERRSLCLSLGRSQALSRISDQPQSSDIKLLDRVLRHAVEIVWKEKTAGMTLDGDTSDPFTGRNFLDFSRANSVPSYDDECLIRAMEFFTIPQLENYSAALFWCNRVIRKFVLCGHLMASLELIGSLPEDTLQHVALLEDSESINARHEFDGWLLFMNVIQLFHEWKTASAFHEGDLSNGSRSISMEAVESKRVRVYDSLHRLFSDDGGWMCDLVPNGVDGDAAPTSISRNDRNAELRQVKVLVYPMLFSLLCQVLRGHDTSVMASWLVRVDADSLDGMALREMQSVVELMSSGLVHLAS